MTVIAWQAFLDFAFNVIVWSCLIILQRAAACSYAPILDACSNSRPRSLWSYFHLITLSVSMSLAFVLLVIWQMWRFFVFFGNISDVTMWLCYLKKLESKILEIYFKSRAWSLPAAFCSHKSFNNCERQSSAVQRFHSFYIVSHIFKIYLLIWFPR